MSRKPPIAGNSKWTAIPARRSKAQDAHLRARIVIGLLLACASLGLLATFAWMSSGGDEVVGAYEPPRGGAVAALAAQMYLTGSDPVVPLVLTERDGYAKPTGSIRTGGSMWSESVEVIENAYGVQGLTLENHTFVFIDEDRLMRITVPVTIQLDGSPTVAGTPAIMPYDLPTEGTALTLLAADAGPSAAVVDKIQRWAGAYLGDRQSELADIAGDPTGSYLGIGGWSLIEAGVLEYGVGDAAGQFIARVRVVAGRGETQMTQVYDLVVNEVGTVPTIVRWGPVGTR